MKRVLLSLLVLAGVLYAAHAVFSANDIKPEPSAGKGAVPSEAASPKIDDVSTQASSQELRAEALTPSPADSRHAISVQQAPAPAAMSSLGSEAASASTTNDEADAKPEQGFMKVTSPASIREGPSTSAAIVGIAKPGAEAQIVSRSTDWVEIIDPGSKKTGWIHESFLTPQEEPASQPVAPEEVDAALAATPEKSRKQASRHQHRRHTIVLGPFILRFR